MPLRGTKDDNDVKETVGLQPFPDPQIQLMVDRVLPLDYIHPS